MAAVTSLLSAPGPGPGLPPCCCWINAMFLSLSLIWLTVSEGEGERHGVGHREEVSSHASSCRINSCNYNTIVQSKCVLFLNNVW